MSMQEAMSMARRPWELPAISMILRRINYLCMPLAYGALHHVPLAATSPAAKDICIGKLPHVHLAAFIVFIIVYLWSSFNVRLNTGESTRRKLLSEQSITGIYHPNFWGRWLIGRALKAPVPTSQ
ncbi:hypothetical protein V8B97DRAFT_1559559 [Scleroderma yunnanense]